MILHEKAFTKTCTVRLLYFTSLLIREIIPLQIFGSRSKGFTMCCLIIVVEMIYGSFVRVGFFGENFRGIESSLFIDFQFVICSSLSFPMGIVISASLSFGFLRSSYYHIGRLVSICSQSSFCSFPIVSSPTLVVLRVARSSEPMLFLFCFVFVFI